MDDNNILIGLIYPLILSLILFGDDKTETEQTESDNKC